jgi:serine protease Do
MPETTSTEDVKPAQSSAKVVAPKPPTLTPQQRRFGSIFAIGLLGGLLGSGIMFYAVGRHLPLSKQQFVVQQNSAVIDVAKKVSPSVVSITSTSTVSNFFGYNQTQSGAGTGIIVSADGYILTNKHVIEGDAANYTVITSDGKQYKNAKLVAKDPVNDIAFLKIDAKGLTPADLGDSTNVVVGQEVVAIGNALGQFQNTVTTGVISGISRPITAGDGQGSDESLQNLFQTDAAINPGNSGGPLVDLSGKVIGMNTAIAGNAQNIGFAIPINEAKSLIASVKTDGKITRAYLGVRYVPITSDFASRNNLNVTSGAYVIGDQQNLAVLPNSPAAKAGVQSGDIITKINNDAITQTNSLTTLISKYKVGDTVSLTIIRNGKEQKVDVKLEEAPAGQ